MRQDFASRGFGPKTSPLMDRDEEATLPDHTPIPSGRLGRMARLGALAVGAASAAVRGRPIDAAADQAAEVLGNLRGLAAKIGQMASYVDGFVPEEIAENLLALGRAEEARPHFARAHAQLSRLDSVERPDEARLARLLSLSR